MAELKTRPTGASVPEFIAAVTPEQKRLDSLRLIEIMESITGAKPQMWGPSIIGFGDYHYVYKSGREGDWFLCGFSPRKQALTIYLMSDLQKFTGYLEKLGKHTTSKGCLYIKKLEDIDEGVLREMIQSSVDRLKEKHESTSDRN